MTAINAPSAATMTNNPAPGPITASAAGADLVPSETSRTTRGFVEKPARFTTNPLAPDNEMFDPASWLCNKSEMSSVAKALKGSMHKDVRFDRACTSFYATFNQWRAHACCPFEFQSDLQVANDNARVLHIVSSFASEPIFTATPAQVLVAERKLQEDATKAEVMPPAIVSNRTLSSGFARFLFERFSSPSRFCPLLTFSVRGSPPRLVSVPSFFAPTLALLPHLFPNFSLTRHLFSAFGTICNTSLLLPSRLRNYR